MPLMICSYFATCQFLFNFSLLPLVIATGPFLISLSLLLIVAATGRCLSHRVVVVAFFPVAATGHYRWLTS